MKRRALPLLVLPLAAACGDGLGPRVWDATPDTVLLYSLTRPELLAMPAAYDFVQLRRVRVETQGATGSWDVALAEEDGAFVFVPAGNFPGIVSRAAINETEYTSLEQATRAPGDTSAYSRLPVRLREGAVYVVRTRTAQCIGFGAGTYYGKFQIISLDAMAGTARFAAVTNQYCNDRALVPEN